MRCPVSLSEKTRFMLLHPISKPLITEQSHQTLSAMPGNTCLTVAKNYNKRTNIINYPIPDPVLWVALGIQ
eukprot:3606794-Rhodomonas_salina.1